MNKALFSDRHIGISSQDSEIMFDKLGVLSTEELLNQTIPGNIRLQQPLNLPAAMSEQEYASHIHDVALRNKTFKNFIGQGWYGTYMPAPIQRNVFENPVWYTSYTPYQAEISQGRLEALLNFQTVIMELTGMNLANCSLLDEATAAAEAALMMYNLRDKEQQKRGANRLLVDRKMFPQTLAVLKTRTELQGIDLQIADYKNFDFTDNVFGILLQYPNSDGSIENYAQLTEQAGNAKIKVGVAADILSLALLVPPGEWGADIVFGSTQRFGIPMFYGGPSAAYFATRDEFKRSVPGRIIGISKDANGKQALRMALQTREQHIKREKATSNICTSQALLATMAGFYAIYHGYNGIREIAERIHFMTAKIAAELSKMKYETGDKNYFDTLTISVSDEAEHQNIRAAALAAEVNLNYSANGVIKLSIDETTTPDDVQTLLHIFAKGKNYHPDFSTGIEEIIRLDAAFLRTKELLKQEVFNNFRTETELMRYIKKLERRDISLTHSMISLGSCTMKLNAASELLPLSRAEFQNIHPLSPADQTEGYNYIISELSQYLSEITGLKGVSFQPNSGAAGEYAGLRVIHEYQKSMGEGSRTKVLIPSSAHGTNPASAVQAGYDVVVVKCSENGDVDLDDLREKAELYQSELAAFMLTYPSTHGIFETHIIEMCEVIHAHGGQVYMDGANMNAQVGYTHPGIIGVDVCHLNLHKTFAIPHGGGGPGVGPICVAEHLIPFLPKTTLAVPQSGITVSSAPFGSAGVLPITYGYIRMMGADGLRKATATAILSANYIAERLKDSYGILFRGEQNRIGHELILECRKIKSETGITETDIAKRLIDYGFHAPTLSFPVAGTLMIEPTESESKAELDRFCDAMLMIYAEIKEIQSGEMPKDNNVLIHAPHPEYEVTADVWNHPYSREKAAYPLSWIRENKFWVNVARIDNAFGDRNLMCGCE